MCMVGTVCDVFCTEIHCRGLKSRFQAGFRTNHAQKLPEISVHAKFTINAGCQIDFPRNHAIIFLQFLFSRSDI